MKNICHVTRMPGSAQGAQVDFMEELQSVIQRKVCVISFGLDFTNQVYCIQGRKGIEKGLFLFATNTF